jgi:DNA-binding transcriptional LysR family regulator
MTRPRLRRYFRHGVLPQLLAFEACVRHGSVTRAADELSLAQPTVSCLIRKLSETLGCRILETRGGRVEPTAAGYELLVLCEELFEAFGRADDRLAALRSPEAVRTATGLPPAVSSRP